MINDPHVISFITDEMLLSSRDEGRVKFITDVARLAEEDETMFKYMLLWMKIGDYNLEQQNEVEKSMKDYLRCKNLWDK